MTPLRKVAGVDAFRESICDAVTLSRDLPTTAASVPVVVMPADA